MMTIGKIANSKGYYENNPENNYYLDDQLQSKFIGKGAKDLGLYGNVVTSDIQENLMKGILPTGETKVRFEQTQKAGYDLTFSAPKSVSVLALVCDDSRLLDAHKKAVELTVNEIEKLSSVRTKEGDSYTFTQTGNLIVATHIHDTSRELDPQLHTHALVFNITKNKDEAYQSLSSDKINKTGFSEVLFSNQVSFGSIYRSVLRNEVESLGFNTINVGKNGLWEIDGVPTNEFSTRRKQIVEKVGEDATAKERDQATIDTRKIKKEKPEELQAEWKNKLEKTGFNKDVFYSGLQGKETPPQKTAEVNNQSVIDAISFLSEEKNQFTHQNIFNVALKQSTNTIGAITEINIGIDAAIKNGLIVPLDQNKTLFISKENIEREVNIISLGRDIDLKPTSNTVKSKYFSDNRAINSYFNENKNIAILSGRTGVAGLIGNIKELNETSLSQGLTPIVITNSQKNEKNLQDNGIINTSSINNLQKKEPNQNSVLIVPQAESLSLKQTETILSQVKKLGGRIIFINNESKIGLGNSIDALKKNGIKEYQLTEKLANVTVKVAPIIDGEQRLSTMVKNYVENKTVENSILVSDNKNDKLKITKLLRMELKNTNQLGREDVSLKVLTPIYLSKTIKSDIDTYKKGMILENWKDNKLTKYEIISVNEGKKTITIQNGKKAEVLSIKNIDKTWNLIERNNIEISKGESLIAIGSMQNGKIKSTDTMEVVKINKNGVIVKASDGRKHNLSLNEEHKISYNYVKSSNQIGKTDSVIYTSLKKSNINQNNLNQLMLSGGGDIKLYSPLGYEETKKKLNNIKEIDTTLTRLKGDEFKSIDTAIEERNKRAFTFIEMAVNNGISNARGSEVFFLLNEVVAKTLESNPKLSIQDVNMEIKKRIDKGDIIFFNTAKNIGQHVGISKETFEQEKIIMTSIAKGVGKFEPLLKENQIKEADLSSLTSGQKSATKLILTSTDQFIGIQGLAGVGKTTQLKSVINQLQVNQPELEIIGLAPTHKAVFEMTQIGVKAQTISSFLVDIQKDEKFNFSNKVFLIDESSMVGNKNTSALYDAISKGGARGIYSGDIKQLLSIDSGSAFSLQQKHSGMKFAVMNEIVRQNKELKPAIYHILNENIGDAFKVANSIDSKIIERDLPFVQLNNVIDNHAIEKGGYSSIIEYIAKDYTSRSDNARNGTLVITQLNEDRHTINKEIHNELEINQKIGNQNIKATILTSINVTEDKLSASLKNPVALGKILNMDNRYYEVKKFDKTSNMVTIEELESKKIQLIEPDRLSKTSGPALYERQDIYISERDKILITKTDIEKGLTANSEWSVTRITDSQMSIMNDSGEHRTLNINEMREKHFDHGYARTDYSSQGASVDFVIGYELSNKLFADMRSFYVMMSRAKEHVTFITDDLDKFSKNANTITDRLSAMDVVDQNNNREYQGFLKEIHDTRGAIDVDNLIKDAMKQEIINLNPDDIKQALDLNNINNLSVDSIKEKIMESIDIIKKELNENSSNSGIDRKINYPSEEIMGINEKQDIVKNFVKEFKNDQVFDQLRKNEQDIIDLPNTEKGEKTL